MNRTLITTAFVGMLALLIWVIAHATTPAMSGADIRPAAEGEKLSIARLGPTESVAIVYRSTGCFHQSERLYQIAADPLRFSTKVINPRPDTENAEDPLPPGKLSDAEAAGLDSYLHFLRYKLSGGCTTTDVIVVGYYRDGKKVGEERFVDRTCQLSGFRRENGKVVARLEDCGRDFPLEVFRSIVPPWLIEERLAKSNPTVK